MISVVIPSYNRASTIIRAIESVLNQTYKEIEVIVVDDGSIDHTESVVLGVKDSRIRYVKLDRNMGACYARNYGINMAKGEYIAFQDSDDEWVKDKLFKQLSYLKEEGADVVFCSFNRCLKKSTAIYPDEKIHESKLHNLLLTNNYVSTQTILGKKDCFIEEPFDNNLPRFQDWDLMIRISKKYRVVHLNEPLLNMYIQSDSISNNPQKAFKACKLIREKYVRLGWFDNERNAHFYDLMGHYAILCNLRGKIYYKNAWDLYKKPKYIFLLMMTTVKMERIVAKYIFNNKIKLKIVNYMNKSFH